MIAALSFACTGDDCVELPASCAPQYEPTFQNVYDNTLAPSCASAGVSCHAAEGAQGGLVLDEIERAHAGLLDSRVTAGDAACSTLMSRVSSSDPGEVMPPGARLSEAERCSLQQWIEQGAKR